MQAVRADHDPAPHAHGCCGRRRPSSPRRRRARARCGAARRTRHAVADARRRPRRAASTSSGRAACAAARKRIDAALRLDRHRRRARLRSGRRSRCTRGVSAARIASSSPEARELQHAAAHQRVRRQRVGAVGAAVDARARAGRARASSSAVAAPAQRAPTTIASYSGRAWIVAVMASSFSRRVAVGEAASRAAMCPVTHSRVVADAVDEARLARAAESAGRARRGPGRA